MTRHKHTPPHHDIDLFHLIEHLEKRKQWLVTQQVEGAVARELYLEEQGRWQGVLGLYGLLNDTEYVYLGSQTPASVSVECVERVTNGLIKIIKQQIIQTSSTTS